MQSCKVFEVQFRVPNPRNPDPASDSLVFWKIVEKLFHPLQPTRRACHWGHGKSGIPPLGTRRPSRPIWQLEPRQPSEEFFTPWIFHVWVAGAARHKTVVCRRLSSVCPVESSLSSWFNRFDEDAWCEGCQCASPVAWAFSVHSKVFLLASIVGLRAIDFCGEVGLASPRSIGILRKWLLLSS
jgi:hypothetical protein